MDAGYRKILVAVDTSEAAEEVLRCATALCPRALERFSVITVIPPVLGGIGGVDGLSLTATWPLQEMESQLTREVGAAVRERVAQFGIAPAQAAVAFGRPASEIRNYAARIGADLIVIGAHAGGGVRGLLGSTANGVVHGTPCDVLVVHVP